MGSPERQEGSPAREFLVRGLTSAHRRLPIQWQRAKKLGLR
jgi:hypothetical protein